MTTPPAHSKPHRYGLRTHVVELRVCHGWEFRLMAGDEMLLRGQGHTWREAKNELIKKRRETA